MLANNIRTDNEERMAVNMTEEVAAEFQAFWDSYQDNPILGRMILFRNQLFQEETK